METVQERMTDILEDNDHVLPYLKTIVGSVLIGWVLEFTTGVNESSFKGVLIIASAFIATVMLAYLAYQAIAIDRALDFESIEEERNEALNTAIKAIEQRNELVLLTQQAQGEVQAQADAFDAIANEVQLLRRNEQVHIKTAQLLKSEIADASKGLSSADELLASASQKIATANTAKSTAENALITCKAELAKYKASASHTLPYKAFFDAYVAQKQAESDYKRATAQGEEKGKATAKLSFDASKEALNELLEKLSS